MNSIFFRSFLLCALCLCARFAAAQTDFSTIDARARQVEFPKKQNVGQLATALTAGLATETEKARAIFVWITANIRYDARLIAGDKVEAEDFKAKQRPTEVLRTKKAVCEGYSNLFHALCQAAGLKSVVATGLTKTRTGRIPRIGHAWNLVRADGEWKLIDATWGAGSLDDDQKFVEAFNDKYFFAEPQAFAQNHFPTDPLFQLVEQPADLTTFKSNKPAPQVSGITMLNGKDTLNAFVELDSAAADLNSAYRILRFDPANGWANFTLAMYQFSVSDRLFGSYVATQQQLMNNRTRPTLEQLQKDGHQLAQIQQQLTVCQQTVTHIPVGDHYYRNGQSLQKTAAVNLKSCQDALQRNQDMQKRLKGKG